MGERESVSLSAREVRPGLGTNSREGPPGDGSREKGCPLPWGHWLGGEGRQMAGSQVKTVGRKEIGMLESWVIDGSEVKSRRTASQRANGRGSQLQTLVLIE